MKTNRYALVLLALAFAMSGARAQEALELPPPGEDRLLGFEFEFAGSGNRVVSFEEMPWENYQRLMKVIVDYYGGDPSTIRRVDFTEETTNLERYPDGTRQLFRAEWADPKGRVWKIEPEFVASTGYDGYELVTPPMDDSSELKDLLVRIRDSGLVREGLKSGTHLNIDGRELVHGQDARALANLIVMHENFEPMLRRIFNPVRGGGHANRFSRSLAVDHPDLLAEIDALPPEQRTVDKLTELFRQHNGREMELHEVDPLDPKAWGKLWKYRSLNLAKVLPINDLHNGNAGVVEFRMFDLEALSNPEAHRLQAEFYRAMVRQAEKLAAEGKVVRFQPRAPMPEGEDPSVYNTPEDPAQALQQARQMIAQVGLNPDDFQSFLEQRIRRRTLPTPAEFKGLVDVLSMGRVEHNGKAFTYGFELEGSGEGFANIAIPKDAEVRARWGSMSASQKKAYYRQTVGESRSSVPQYFDLDLERYPWLDPSWKVEGTGNWEVRSRVFESLEEATSRMREIKQLTGRSGKGFHLHMRDNGVDWDMLEAKGAEFADYIERSSNWVWLMRARRLGTMTSLKSWSNNRFTNRDLESVSKIQSSSRHTVRVTVPSSKEFIDLEIRGFTTFVDDIELLGKLYTNALQTGNFGPWKFTDNPLPNSESVKTDLSLAKNFERYLNDVEGQEMTPELRRVIGGFQDEYINKAKGTAREYPTNVATPLLPWENEASVPESLRRELKYKRDAYLRSLRFTANKVMNGDYGLDLDVASEQALVEKLGLSPETAKALVEYRRAVGGQLGSPDDVARVLALGEATGDLEKAARLGKFDVASANQAALQNRQGLSAEQTQALVDLRGTHDVVDALEREGLSEEQVLQLIENSKGLDLNSLEATPERMVELLGITPEAAAKIAELRQGHSLTSDEDLRAAGLTAEQAEQVLDVVTRTTDLNTASPEELKTIGLNESEVEKLQEARQAHYFRGYDDLAKAGLGADVIEALRTSHGVNRRKLNTLSAEQLVEATGISPEDAERIVAYREQRDVRSVEELSRWLGADRAEAIVKRAAGLDLATVSGTQLAREGVDPEVAERLVEYRDPLELGRRYAGSPYYDAGAAAKQLQDLGLIDEAQAETLKQLTPEVALESSSAQVLQERFGLSEESAKRVVGYRDAHDLNNAEALVENGLFSEEEAERFVRLNRPLDVQQASKAELMERGLSEAEALKVKALLGTDLAKANAEALADFTDLDPRQAERLVLYRDPRSFAEALEALNKQSLQEEFARRAEGVDLTSTDMSMAEMARRLGVDPRTVKRILTYRDGNTLGSEADMRRALGEQGAKLWGELAHNVDLNTASVEELTQLTISEEVARKIVAARQPRTLSGMPELMQSGIELTTLRTLQNSDVTLEELGGLSAEQLVERTGIPSMEADRIVRYLAPRDVTDRGVLVDLLGEETGQKVFDRGRYNQVDLAQASAEELAQLGLSEAEAKALISARSAHALNAFPDVLEAGVDLTALRALQNSGLTGDELRTLGVDELAERGGISAEDARKIVEYRDAQDVNQLETLRGLLAERGEALYRRARINLSRDGEPKLAEVMGEQAARRLVNFRDAHSLGGSYNFNAEQAAQELLERGVIRKATAQRIRDLAGKMDLSTVTVDDLMGPRFGLTKRQASRILRARDAHPIGTTQELAQAIQLKKADAEQLLAKGQGLDLSTATVEDLVARGIGQAEAEALVAFREQARNVEGLDYTEITRQVRYKVKVWAKDNDLAESLLRSLLPRANPEDVTVVAASTEANEGQGFGRTRRGSGAPVDPTSVDAERVGEVFAAVKEGAEARLAERMIGAKPEDRAVLQKGLEAVRGLKLDVLASDDIQASLGEDGRVKISSGLLDEIDRRAEGLNVDKALFRARALALILGHEAAHASGIKTERVADAEGLKIVEASRLGSAGTQVALGETEIRETVRVFDKPTGASHVDNMFNRLRSLFRYGTVRGREKSLARESRGETDPLQRYRRVDGTLEWKKVVRDRALQEGAGLAHFGLALFLKEVAVVARTGDRARIEEFFDGLMTTDFYKQYGLFVVGARAGEVAYTRYLERFVKPRFVNGILKTNLVLATGIALPQLIDGTFEGKAFAISLGSLGLSSAAVKAGMSGIKWVVDLSRVKETRAIQRLAGMRRLARFGGWLYSAAELAVVLYLADDLEHAVNGWLDRRAARKGLAQAGATFLDAVIDPKLTADSLLEAAGTYHSAWADYRNFLYQPMLAEEQTLARRLQGVARSAKRADDQREAMLKNLGSNSALAANIRSRGQSLQDYAKRITAEADAGVAKDVDGYLATYQKNRNEELRAVYEDGRRDGKLLGKVQDVAWTQAGGGGLLAIGRRTGRSRVISALEDVSGNRLQTYDDELEVVRYAQRQLREAGQADLAATLDALSSVVNRTAQADHHLYEGDDAVVDVAPVQGGKGASELVQEALEASAGR